MKIDKDRLLSQPFPVTRQKVMMEHLGYRACFGTGDTYFQRYVLQRTSTVVFCPKLPLLRSNSLQFFIARSFALIRPEVC
jgi:hypothetical protein